MIISDNWANVDVRCHHVSVKIGFVIPDWGGPAATGSRIFYPPDSRGSIRTFEFQGHPGIVEN